MLRRMAKYCVVLVDLSSFASVILLNKLIPALSGIQQSNKFIKVKNRDPKHDALSLQRF